MSVPKLRFRGFTEEWEKKKLGEITKRVKGNDGRMNLPTLTISAKNGWMRQEDRFSSNIAGAEQKNYTLLSKGELSYNHGNSKLAKYGVVYSLKHINEALVPKVYQSFKTTKFFYNLFIEYLFMSKIPDRELRKLISSGARMDGLLNIGYDEFMGINVILPEFEEQQKIGDFFMLLDKRIEQQEQKIALLKDYKKAMMQKIFSQKIRFKDENGNDYPDWEEKKLGEIGKFLNNRREAITEALRKNGKYPYYGATGIIDSVEEYIFDQEIILLGEDGAKWGENEESAFYVNHKCWVNNHAHVIEVNGNSVFLKEYLNFLELRRYVSGNAPAKLTLENARKILLNTPSFQEQEKIAFFLTSINKRIEKQENTLDKMQEYKEALLHKIFI